MTTQPVQSQVLTVSAYAARLGVAVREVGAAILEGETQKVNRRPNGMVFFDLTDGESTLSCKVFPRDAGRLQHMPRDGDLVRVRVDRPDLWAARGSLSLIVSDIRLAGEGELLRRRADLLERLRSEGLCEVDRRRPLPRFPRAVGVIAGAGSDGLSDVKQALADRWPAVHIVQCASLVQGAAAPRQLIDALATLQEHPLVDVIIMARGGGSVQDLVAFDDEALCRAIFACEKPVVCAIGHTDNTPVCNHVTWAAYTPSRSAELVVPSATDLRRDIAVARDRLGEVQRAIALRQERVFTSATRFDVAYAIATRSTSVRSEWSRIASALRSSLDARTNRLGWAAGVLVAAPHRASRDLAQERETLASAHRTLEHTGERITSVARDVRELGVRVHQGVRRQLADHVRDYGHATARLIREAGHDLARRDVFLREALTQQTVLLSERTRRRLESVRIEVDHRLELIRAHDFRSRGWLLAEKDGTPVRSIKDLAQGDTIQLHLQDGRAEATIESTHADPDHPTTDS